jgi:hypothetical protein
LFFNFGCKWWRVWQAPSIWPCLEYFIAPFFFWISNVVPNLPWKGQVTVGMCTRTTP